MKSVSSAARALACCAITLLLFLGCTDQPTSPSTPLSLSYTVRIPSMHRDSVMVKLVATDIPEGQEFVLPLVYADNPPDSLTGSLASALTVTDSSGRAIAYTSLSRQIGPITCTTIKHSVPAVKALVIAYRINFDAIFNDSVNGPISLIFLNSQTGYLQGTHLFAVPYEPSLVQLWRAPRNISLTIETGSGISAVGLPASSISLRNAYEILFVQLVLNGELLANVSGGGQSAAFYGLSGFEQSSQAQLSAVAAQYSTILDTLVPIWGKLSSKAYPVIFHNQLGGGMEGIYSFVCKPPHIDKDTLITMVLAHETIHHMVGIRCGERDDPWWKEGTTFYLGFAVASRLGMVPKQKVFDAIGDTLVFEPQELALAPSDDFTRAYLFFSRLYNVGYFKGAQIAMLMDLAVRLANNNRMRLDEVTAELCRRYDGSTFSRHDFIAHFKSHAHVDISSVLTRFADKPGNIPQAILHDAFSRLDGLGAFGGDTAVSMAKAPFHKEKKSAGRQYKKLLP